MKKYTFAAAALILVFLASAVGAGEGKISGYMFGEYYYVVSADDAAGAPEKQNAFQFRRIYFTYDKGIDDRYSIRYRLETKDAGFGNAPKMVPFTKIAYLKVKGGVAGADLYLGLSGTPTWKLSEKLWGYRSIEKTILDLNKIGSSADIGVALKGKGGSLAYHVMVANGPGQKPENDNGKKIYASVSLQPGATQIEGYVDYNMMPGDANELTLKGFAGVKKEALRGGVELFTRINQKAGVAKKAGKDETITGASVFAALALGDALDGFGRLDMISNNDTDTTDLLVIAGLDRTVAENVHLMPNLIVEMPDGPDPSITARVTAYYKY